MEANVFMTLWLNGQIIDYREGHNVWVNNGRSYLANLITDPAVRSATLTGSVSVSDPLVLAALNGQSFDIAIDGNPAITITFVNPTTAADVVNQLNDQLVGAGAVLIVSDVVRIVSSTSGLGSSLVTDNGPAAVSMGLPMSDIVATESRRVSYLGFGIGGNKQAQLASVGIPPLSVSYPAGSDPNMTTGNEYDADFPVAFPISTLERPVRISGGSAAYPGVGTDKWLLAPPPLEFNTARGGGDTGVLVNPAEPPYTPGDASFTAGVDTGNVVFSGIVDTNVGDILYGPFTQMPLSEVGLFLSGASPTGNAFNNGSMVAYHSFVTISLVPTSILELVRQVRF
jgi:hypothetical protein